MLEALTLEKPLAILGTEDAVIGFRALGFTVYSVKSLEESRAALQEVINQKSAVCLVQEDLYAGLKEEIGAYRKEPLPIFLPFSRGGTPLLEQLVRDIRLRATGTL